MEQKNEINIGEGVTEETLFQLSENKGDDEDE